MKTIIAKRTLQRPADTYKPAEIDPLTGGQKVAGSYDVDVVRPGETVDWDDDAEADKLVARGCAVFPESKAQAPEPSAPAPKPVVPAKPLPPK